MRTFILSPLVIAGLVFATCSVGNAAEDKLAIGDRVSDFELQDFQGQAWQLEPGSKDNADNSATLIVFVGTECPLVKLYSSKLETMQAEYGDRLRVVAVNSNQQDTLLDIAKWVKENELTYTVLKDPGNKIADQFGASRTPEAFLLDSEMRVRYRGRIDDQFTYGLQRPKVEHEYVKEAIESVLEGRKVAVSETEIVGCHIGRLLEADESSPVTYSNQVARILQKNCVSCHRAGEIGPFALTDYDEVKGWAEMIAEVVEDQRMPPWHADPKHGEFSNDASLTSTEKEAIFQWVDAGAAQGNPADLPAPLEFVEGWQIGEPDITLTMAEEITVQATGEMAYQHVLVDQEFTEDTWIKAAECRPGNRSVVHHIILGFAGRDRKGRLTLDSRKPWIAATAPGAPPMELPEGFAKKIPAGSKLVFQIHYTPNGKAQTDRSQVGFTTVDASEVKHEIYTMAAIDTKFVIPPNEEKEVVVEYKFRRDVVVTALFPHMHLRGKSFRYEILTKDREGAPEVLLDVPNYDFNWQNSYIFDEPKKFKAGTTLRCVAVFDNTKENFANPAPNETVRWGDQTDEEMMIGYFDMYFDASGRSTKKR